MVEPSTGNTPGTLQPETVSTKLRRIAMRVQQPLRASAAPRVRTAAVGGGIRERICQMKNRMREIRTSGSVRGEGGNPLAYSTFRLRTVQNEPNLARPGQSRVPTGERCETNPIFRLRIADFGLQIGDSPAACRLGWAKCAKRTQFGGPIVQNEANSRPSRPSGAPHYSSIPSFQHSSPGARDEG